MMEKTYEPFGSEKLKLQAFALEKKLEKINQYDESGKPNKSYFRLKTKIRKLYEKVSHTQKIEWLGR